MTPDAWTILGVALIIAVWSIAARWIEYKTKQIGKQ